MTTKPRYSILRPYKFLVDNEPQIDGASSAWVAARIHHHLARAADLVAADLVAGRLNMGDHKPSNFERVRISQDIVSAKTYSWGAALTGAPRSSFWLPLQDRGIRKQEISVHLALAARMAEEELDTSRVALEFTALCKDLSNHQLIALRALAEEVSTASGASA